ncbi:DUF3085 domain-containing protein [Nocardia ignorata]|uniref:DUF3085 family protein n=1 Tax=Nocardia ignorata TaxID=145285 RepID=A0A4R6NYW3_NOCIG|nr:DUF3085 domain-containing protein [Nocardia ignorata]TDP28414.1 DUF3085 family protein [Nocardia ignorata]
MRRSSSFEFWFPLRQVLLIAEHAMATSEHSWPKGDTNKPNPVPPALVWAKDDGIHLRSNGLPWLLADPTEPDGPPLVVHAVGYDNHSHFDFSGTAVGGDDFVEYIDLTESFDGVTLIEMIRYHAAHGGILILTAHFDSFTISFSSAATDNL